MIFKQISSFLKTFLNSRDFRRMKKRIMFMLTLLFFPAIASCEQIVGIATQQGEELILPEGDMVRVDVWIKNLDIPWSLIFLPDGRALVSERPGSIRLITNGKLRVKPYALVDVSSRGEGGLMGLALHPAFPKKPYVYAMHTYRNSTGLFNRVIRLRDKESLIRSLWMLSLPGDFTTAAGPVSARTACSM
jgi:quinoprotein glucose dehydrogenase